MIDVARTENVNAVTGAVPDQRIAVMGAGSMGTMLGAVSHEPASRSIWSTSTTST